MYSHANEYLYRGLMLRRFKHGNGNWVIFNTLGHIVGRAAGYDGQLTAEMYIDTIYFKGIPHV
jgi:hypothetical protein